MVPTSAVTTVTPEEAIDPVMEIRSAVRAYMKAPHKRENRTALLNAMDAYEATAYERCLAALKAEFGK